jgi:hypothetical protein
MTSRRLSQARPIPQVQTLRSPPPTRVVESKNHQNAARTSPASSSRPTSAFATSSRLRLVTQAVAAHATFRRQHGRRGRDESGGRAGRRAQDPGSGRRGVKPRRRGIISTQSSSAPWPTLTWPLCLVRASAISVLRESLVLSDFSHPSSQDPGRSMALTRGFQSVERRAPRALRQKGFSSRGGSST